VTDAGASEEFGAGAAEGAAPDLDDTGRREPSLSFTPDREESFLTDIAINAAR
jgi:hypothetical protein